MKNDKNYSKTPHFDILLLKINLATLLRQIQTAPLDTSNMITKWKVREPFPEEEALGHLDAKTRIMINGLVINNSYTKNGGFSYECYLKYSNLVFDGSEYVEFKNSPTLITNIESMVEEIRKALLHNDNNITP